MSWFDTFLANIDFIRFRLAKPFLYCISVLITTVVSPFLGEGYYCEFKKPEDVAYVGETMEITPDYTIVIGADASEADKNAAEKLRYYFDEISGIKLDIVNDTSAESEKEIIIGKTNREGNGFDVDRTSLGDDGIVIKTVGEKLILSGAEKRGAIYAVYNFLEEYFDCRWFTHDLTVIPEKDKLTIPKAIDYTYTPAIAFRATDWISPSRSNEYKAANGLNTDLYGAMSDSYGDGIAYAGSFAHNLQNLLDVSLIETNPELFALGVESGERTVNQLCLTNPETLRLVIEGVRKSLKNNPNAEIISVTQNDNQDYCVCENCKKVDEEEGSHAGTMLRFVNAIADNIREDYPDVMVDTFAYQYTRKPPKITVPRDNVIVRLCSIECTFSSPLDGGYSEENTAFAEDIRGWSSICNNLHIWDYTTDYAHYLAPFGDFDVIQRNIQFFAENNVVGIYEEGNYSASSSDGEFAELRCYLLSKLMWNPYCDVNELMYDFCEAYYGDGYQGVIDFINYIDKNSGGFSIDFENWWITVIPTQIKTGDGMGIYSNVTSTKILKLHLGDEFKIDKMWQTAKDGAKTDWQKENVERSEICWRYWKACNARSEFNAFNPKLQDEYRELYSDFQRFGITRLNEGADGLLTENPDFSMPPNRWEK